MQLPKWPGLIVSGKKLTQEQMYKVMFATADFHTLTNQDKSAHAKLLGGEKKDFYYEYGDSLTNRGNLRNLYFMRNQRVFSSWVGGTHGWLDWDGTVRASSYNIGKWPTEERIEQELELIASKFDFLEMEVQILNNEILDDQELTPLLQYEIHSGALVQVEPQKDLLIPIEEFPFDTWDNRKELCPLWRLEEMLKFNPTLTN